MKSNINFENIEYLKEGNNKQKRAYEVLTRNGIVISLKEFAPILVGTIPINIDLDDSDLDVVCYFNDRNAFEKLLIEKGYKTEAAFAIELRLEGNPYEAL